MKVKTPERWVSGVGRLMEEGVLPRPSQSQRSGMFDAIVRDVRS
jgi:hypothetical protein